MKKLNFVNFTIKSSFTFFRLPFVITLFSILFFHITVFAEKSILHTKPGQQDNIVTTDSAFAITHGISEETYHELKETVNGNETVILWLFDILDKKNVKVELRNGEVRRWIGKFKEFKNRLDKQAGTSDVTIKAGKLLVEGDFAGIELLLTQSLENSLQTKAVENKKTAASLAYDLGSVKALQLEYQEAQRFYEQAVQLDPQNCAYLNNLGTLFNELGQHQKSIECFTKALDVCKQMNGEKHPEIATYYNNIGVTWKLLGEYDKAITYYRKALDIHKKSQEDDPSQIVVDYSNLGSAWYALGKYSNAIENYTNALTISEKIYGKKHPKVAVYYNNIGGAWYLLGKYRLAIESFENSLEIEKEVYGEKYPKLATRYSNLGGAWYALGGYRKAIENYTKAVEIQREVQGEKRPEVAMCYYHIGDAWKKLGKYQNALEYFTRAFEIFSFLYGGEHPRTVAAQKNINSLMKTLMKQ